MTLWVSLSNNLIIAKLEISSVNGASIFTIFCSHGFIIIFSLGNIVNDQLKKLKKHSCKLNIPSIPTHF